MFIGEYQHTLDPKGRVLAFSAQAVRVDSKTVRVPYLLMHLMLFAFDARHLDPNSALKKVAMFPPDIAENLSIMQASHNALPRPEGVGRSIHMPEPKRTH